MNIRKISKMLKSRNFKASCGMVFGTVLYCFSVVWILDLGVFYAGGITGISQLLTFVFGKIDINISKSIFVAVLNVPLFLIGWKHVSRRFAVFSLTSVIIQVVLIFILDELRKKGFDPFFELKDERMLLAIIGGLLTGLGCGLCLRSGASSGGMDIISQYMSLKRGIPFAKFSFIVDAIVIITSGLAGSISDAAFTIVRLIAHIITLDKIHTIYKYMRIVVVTTEKDKMRLEFIQKFNHGVTIYPVVGGYSNTPKWVLEVVISTYEVEEYRAIINEIDKKAFTTCMDVKGVYGAFNHNVIA